jgi:curved DNA-binding protein CbpA
MEDYEDYYALLKVPETAPIELISAAYRRLALQYHPDRQPNDAVAKEIFERATEAFAVLSNRQRRALYDRDRTVRSPWGERFPTITRYGARHRSSSDGFNPRPGRSESGVSELRAALATEWPKQGQTHRRVRAVPWGPHRARS